MLRYEAETAVFAPACFSSDKLSTVRAATMCLRSWRFGINCRALPAYCRVDQVERYGHDQAGEPHEKQNQVKNGKEKVAHVEAVAVGYATEFNSAGVLDEATQNCCA